MQYGHFIGLNRQENRLVLNTEPMMLEDFMLDHSIESSQDVIGPYELGFAERLKPSLTKNLLRYIHGSDDPRVVSAARNTSLFEPRGPSMGHVGGSLDMSLSEFAGRLKPELSLSMPEKPPGGQTCRECGRSFPEPDGFMGITGLDKIHRCFACHQKAYEERGSTP